ncbi:MAG: hypothetical protein APR62_02120 [Smithella sp. SDB]|nr:MAG: hypothetical protein APR62_02120 [Smithella sp. SDB]
MKKKTEYQISSSVSDGILEIVVTGELAESARDNMLLNEVISITKAKSLKNVLVDIRALKGRSGILETYERVRNYPSHMYELNFAIVDIMENADFQSFHETTAVNAGMSLEWFSNINAARAWLKSNDLPLLRHLTKRNFLSKK